MEILDKRLDYTNLFAVCRGKTGSERHCDTKKGDIAQQENLKQKYLPIQLNPTVKAHIQALKYTSQGTLSSVKELHDEEINEVLNLNAEFLKNLRSKEFKVIFARSKRDKKKMQRLLESRLNENPPFKGMYEYMLKRFT